MCVCETHACLMLMKARREQRTPEAGVRDGAEP